MVMLTMLGYFGAAIVFAIVMAIAGAIFGSGVVIVLLMAIGILGLVIGLYWFLFRFLVGLPGVALGHSPDFFKDVWPLARGEGFGLPLRILLATLIAYVPMVLIVVIFGGSAFMEFVAALGQQQGNDDPSAIFPVMADLMDRMIPISVASTLMFTPVMWFMTLLVGDCI